jgi:hypothetical protein
VHDRHVRVQTLSASALLFLASVAHAEDKSCAKLRESVAASPGLDTMLQLADCYERSGRTASAWAEFRDAADLALTTGDAREAVARRRADSLESRLAYLKVVLGAADDAPPGLELRRDGVVLPTPLWGVAVPVDPGDHVVVASAPGRATWEKTITVPWATSLDIHVPVLDEEPRVDSGRRQRTMGAVVVGAGIVGLGVGAFFALQAKTKLDQSNADGHCAQSGGGCDPTGQSLRSDSRQATTISIVALAVGGAALIVGAVLFATAPRPARASAFAVRAAGTGVAF